MSGPMSLVHAQDFGSLAVLRHALYKLSPLPPLPGTSGSPLSLHTYFLASTLRPHVQALAGCVLSLFPLVTL